MTADQPETDAFLAFVEKKIAALQALVDSYRYAMAVGALGQPGEEMPSFGSNAAFGAPSGGGFDLPTGVFLGLSMPSAIKLLFTSTKRKHTPKDVADVLRDGGFESTSVNFEKMVGTTMHRMKSNGELLQFKDGWGLAELYPEALRNRLAGAKEAKPSKGGGKKVRRSPQRKGAAKAAKTQPLLEAANPVQLAAVG